MKLLTWFKTAFKCLKSINNNTRNTGLEADVIRVISDSTLLSSFILHVVADYKDEIVVIELYLLPIEDKHKETISQLIGILRHRLTSDLYAYIHITNYVKVPMINSYKKLDVNLNEINYD